MLSRREMLRGAIAAGGAVSLSAGASAKAEATHLVPSSGGAFSSAGTLAKAEVPPSAPPDTQRGQEPDLDTREIAKAMREMEGTLLRAYTVSTETVGLLRKGFDTFVRAHGKFPDFNEVGMGVFFHIYDWHVKNRQVITVQKQPDNRYTIQFMFTQLILRYDYDPTYIGAPYDNR